MNCNVIQDLIPLCIDGCCSSESEMLIKEHIASCEACSKLYGDMQLQPEIAQEVAPPVKLHKISDWKASVMQSVLLFVSFALITFGVTLEAQTPVGESNGFWALALIVPSAGFMLSLANWYFVRLYKSRKSFSACAALVTLIFTAVAYVWVFLHYGFELSELLLPTLLTVMCSILSKLLSGQYAKMLGKE